MSYRKITFVFRGRICFQVVHKIDFLVKNLLSSVVGNSKAWYPTWYTTHNGPGFWEGQLTDSMFSTITFPAICITHFGFFMSPNAGCFPAKKCAPVKKFCIFFEIVPTQRSLTCLLHTVVYYIKVSGIPSGNKLIKMIRYPHMWRYDIFTCEGIDDFTDIKFASLIVLKFVGVSSKHLWVFLESLRESSEIVGHLRKFSEILGKCLGTFVWPSEQFWKILEIFGKFSEIFGKSSKTPSSVTLYNKKNITH